MPIETSIIKNMVRHLLVSGAPKLISSEELFPLTASGFLQDIVFQIKLQSRRS